MLFIDLHDIFLVANLRFATQVSLLLCDSHTDCSVKKTNACILPEKSRKGSCWLRGLGFSLLWCVRWRTNSEPSESQRLKDTTAQSEASLGRLLSSQINTTVKSLH